MLTKPKAKLVGADSNIFNLMAICAMSLKDANQSYQVKPMIAKVTSSKSFDEALCVLMDYCDVE